MYLTPEAPFPPAGGGALRSSSLLTYLSRRYTVDVVVFQQPGEADPAARFPEGMVRRIEVITLPANARYGAARLCRNAGRLLRGVPPLIDRFSGFTGRVAEFVRGRRYELGVIEHFWCAPYWAAIAPACERTLLDLHNVESALHDSCARAEGPAAGVAHRIFRRASLALEREWLPKFTLLLAPSKQDAARVNAVSRGSRVVVYPNAVPCMMAPAKREEDAIVFSGNLEYHPNVSAVRYFRTKIWPILRERWPGLVWRLVGQNPAGVRKFATGDDRIEVVGPVENAVAELARAKVAVVPLLAGSGTRLKIIEAWAAGVPVVSTSLGAEGLPARHGQEILLADDAAAFARTVSSLLDSAALRQRIGTAGRRLFEKSFTWDAAWRALDL